MKLLRIKITDPAGFRSLPCGFEHYFRSECSLQDELARLEGFAPFVCAGPNGSGKSNLLEALAAIFFQLEILRVRRSFLPEVLQSDELDFSPVAFELEILIRVRPEFMRPDSPERAKVGVWKEAGKPVSVLVGKPKRLQHRCLRGYQGRPRRYVVAAVRAGLFVGRKRNPKPALLQNALCAVR